MKSVLAFVLGTCIAGAALAQDQGEELGQDPMQPEEQVVNQSQAALDLYHSCLEQSIFQERGLPQAERSAQSIAQRCEDHRLALTEYFGAGALAVFSQEADERIAEELGGPAPDPESP